MILFDLSIIIKDTDLSVFEILRFLPEWFMLCLINLK
jgi:hypothetical protein